MNLVSHCHTHHSFDSSLSPVLLVEHLKLTGVDAVIICDHDLYGLSNEEELLFKDSGIALLRGIEFTTQEGVHIIGVHRDIKLLEREAYSYGAASLIENLRGLGATIIFPHPSHATGVLGCDKVNESLSFKLLESANFIEIDNFRYGPTFARDIKKIKEKFRSFQWLIGSDAHKVWEASAYVNVVSIALENELDLKNIIDDSIGFNVTRRRSKLYFYWKKAQKTTLYQFLINLLSSKIRQRIKKIFGII